MSTKLLDQGKGSDEVVKFLCKNCQYQGSVEQFKGSDPKLPICPKCKTNNLKCYMNDGRVLDINFKSQKVGKKELFILLLAIVLLTLGAIVFTIIRYIFFTSIY